MARERAAIWIDPATGLVWQTEPAGQMTWKAAMAHAQRLVLDGWTDWRVPAVIELESLLDRTRYRPGIRRQVPFQDTRAYWSSTTFAKNTQNAWIVMFDGAYILSYGKQNAYWVRCVRGRLISVGDVREEIR